MRLLAATLLAATGAMPASALTFHLTDTGGAGVGTQARAGFEAAASYWSSVFTDNVTVNLNIGFQSLGTGILGSTGSTRALIATQDYYTGLYFDQTDTLDASAVSTLRPLTYSPSFGLYGVGGQVNAYLTAARRLYTDSGTRFDNDGSVNNIALAINLATSRALGYTTDVNGNPINYSQADGSITFSTNFAFDFNPTDGIDANSFDFIGVAIHEIGHALGFVSGVDSYDFYTRPGGPGGQLSPGALDNFVVLSGLDMFRYGSAGLLDWTTQSVPYFSIDGGVTQLFGDSRFSTGVYNGDGRQASHWKDSPAGAPQLGILDPTSARGQRQEITALDLSAFDAIGWDLAFNPLTHPGYRYSTASVYAAFHGTTVPEPATWALMLGGLGMVGAMARRRGRGVTG